MDCVNHNKILLFNCDQCNIRICSTCVSSQHKGHTFSELDSSSTTSKQIENETNNVVKSINELDFEISEEDHIKNCKRILDFIQNHLWPMLGTSGANTFTSVSLQKSLNIIKEGHIKKKELVKDKIKQYHQDLDQLELELNQKLDIQYNENKEKVDMVVKRIKEAEDSLKNNIEDLMVYFENFTQNNNGFKSKSEEYSNLYKFSSKTESYLPYIQQFVEEQEKLQEYIKLSEVELVFNDEVIKQLASYSNVEFQEKSDLHLLINNIVLDPFLKEKQFKINGGQRVTDIDRVALKPLLNIPEFPIPKVKELYFTDNCILEFTPNLIPDSVTSIYLGNTRYPITKESIPKNIKEIYFCNGYSHEIPSNLLENISTNVDVYFGNIKFKFQKVLKLGNMVGKVITFNNYKSAPIPIDYVPSINLVLCLGELGFPIDKIDCFFDKLKLINGFNQILNSTQVSKFLRLSFQGNHLYPFEAHDLQSRFGHFDFKNNYNHPIIIKDLNSIRSLSIGSIKSPLTKDNLSNNSIEKIYFLRNFNQIINHHIIPTSITTLVIGNVLYEPDFTELKSLVILKLVNNYSFPNSLNTIPSNVEELCLGKLSFEIKAHNIPPTIKAIVFDHYFDQDFQPLLLNNNNIETLKLGIMSKKYSQRCLSNPLPSNIKNLELYCRCKIIIGPGFISSSVKTLYLEEININQFQPKSIPKTLKTIKTSSNNSNLLLPLLPFTIPSIKIEIIEHKIAVLTKETYPIGRKHNY